MPPKKGKGQTMSLADFTKILQTEVPAGGAATTSWADEEIVLPSAPLGLDRPSYENRPGRYPARVGGREDAPLPVVIDQHSLPRLPPFMAFVGNLSHEATDDQVRAFFGGATVKGVRFPRGPEPGPRGFCYVEFFTVEALTEALLKSGQSLAGRPCRIDIATAKREERDTKIEGNWRDGHQVVERSSRGFEKSVSQESTSRSSMGSLPAAQGSWRDTAKPVDADPSAFVGLPPQARPAGTPTQPAIVRRPELKLLPRTLPIEGEERDQPAEEYKRSSKPNPFGAARPRESVLADKEKLNP